MSCAQQPKFLPTNVSAITIEPLYLEEDISIRALEIDKSGMIAYAANTGRYGFIDVESDIQKHEQLTDSIAQTMEFRGLSFSKLGVNFISAGSPALLYKVSYSNWEPKLVYTEEAEETFYDSMHFWDDKNGIAFGDAMNGCMSVLKTENGGETWRKISCKNFPPAYDHEGAFAASDTNIEVVGNNIWLASRSKIYHSKDAGESWTVQFPPIVQDEATQGIYSVDFHSDKIGVAIGGDYTTPELNEENLLFTATGGRHWYSIASATSPGYRSCIQFIPDTHGRGLLAVGFAGINISMDGGETWRQLSDQSAYTVRFQSPTKGVFAGKGGIWSFTLN